MRCAGAVAPVHVRGGGWGWVSRGGFGGRGVGGARACACASHMPLCATSTHTPLTHLARRRACAGKCTNRAWLRWLASRSQSSPTWRTCATGRQCSRSAACAALQPVRAARQEAAIASFERVRLLCVKKPWPLYAQGHWPCPGKKGANLFGAIVLLDCQLSLRTRIMRQH